MWFDAPLSLLLLLLLPLIAWRFRPRRSGLRFSSLSLLPDRPSLRERARTALFKVLPWTLLTVAILALARPQFSGGSTPEYATGIDIMLAIDVSGSMRALDFHPKNRLTVVKEVVREFIADRTGDRVGVISFSGVTHLESPLTMDYRALQELVDSIDFHENSSTAIGLALASALNRLRASEATSRVVILLTDGENTAGELDPKTATQLGKQLGIRTYTIGVGKKGKVPFPVDGVFGGTVMEEVPIDEELLTHIATETGGVFYRATDPDTLSEIYRKIAELERSRLPAPAEPVPIEAFPHFLAGLILLIALDLFLLRLLLRSLP